MRGPVQRQVDLALAKTLKVSERFSGEFRWEMFNLLNQATFANPNAALPAAGFGTMGLITQTVGGPRTMQAAVRVRF